MATKTVTPKDKLSSNNLIIIMLLVTLLVVGISGLVAKTLIASIGVDTKVVGAKAKAEKQLKDDIKAAPNLVSAYDALGPQGAILEDALPTTPDFPGLLVLMENISLDAGMKLKTVSRATVVGADPAASAAAPAEGQTPTPQAYPVIVTVGGTYISLLTFLDHIEKSARPMHVTGVHLSGSGSSLTGDIDIDTYYQAKSELPFSKEQIKK